jgi:single-strand DNA-binding protein
MSGNIVADPEVFAPEGSEYTKLTWAIANNDKRMKNRQTGEWEDYVSFIQCEYWTKNPTKWINRIVKGAGCVVEGLLKQERWEKDGNKGSRIVIELSSWPLMLEKAPNTSSQTSDTYSPPKEPVKDRFEDDIPF